MRDARGIRESLRALMRPGGAAALSDRRFNDLALQTFRFQFQHNESYRRYCARRGCIPEAVTDWRDIPAVPTAAFKEVALCTGAVSAAALTFRTSGTTRGSERRGTHYLLDASLYEESLLAGFRSFLLPDRARMRMIALTPPSSELPDSSLSYMISTLLRELGTAESAGFAHASSGIDCDALRRALAEAQEPVCLLGTSLAYLHFLDALGNARIRLPAGSRLMDTGGFKGERREITAPEMQQRYTAQLGIPAQYCVNEYGMTELCTQYYDVTLKLGSATARRSKAGPPWVRARVVDPETLESVSRGETGILQHFDLANLYSVSAILTEDLAREEPDGFVLLGRAPGAMPRGCSIAMDMLLQEANRP